MGGFPFIKNLGFIRASMNKLNGIRKKILEFEKSNQGVQEGYWSGPDIPGASKLASSGAHCNVPTT